MSNDVIRNRTKAIVVDFGDLALLFISIFLTIIFSFEYPDATGLYFFNLFTQFLLYHGTLVSRDKYGVHTWKLMFYLYFCFNVIRGGVIVAYDQMGFLHPYISAVPWEDQQYGAIIFFIGILFTSIGYHYRHKKRYKFKTNRFIAFMSSGVNANRTQIFLLYALALLFCLLTVAFSDSSGLISSKRVFSTDDGVVTRFGPIRFGLGALYLCLLVLLYNRYYKKGNIFDLAIPAILLCGIGVIISLRIFIVLPLLPLFFDVFRKLSVRKLLITILLFGGLVFIIAFTSGKRAHGDAYRIGSPLQIGEEFLVAVVVNSNFGGYLASGISTSLIGDLAPVLYGKTLVVSPITQFVPRAIYPEKPEELGGEVRKLLQATGFFSEFMQGGVPPGLFAESWLNFRWAGVVFIGFLFGSLLSKIDTYRYSTRNASEFAYLTVTMLIVIFFSLGGVVSRVVMMLIQMNIILLTLAVIKKLFGDQRY